MLNRAVIVVLLALPFMGWAQHSDLLQSFLATSPVNAPHAQRQLNAHITHLKSKQSKKEMTFLHQIFWSTQKRFLKTYQPYEPFGELFESGKYDCLTATGLYSILLKEFGFEHSIIETNYHIFILVHTIKGDVLFETTDRYDGFVQDRSEIEKRIGTYQQNVVASSRPKFNYYLYSFNLYSEISSSQIVGLLHFNQAVKAFNKQEWMPCANQLAITRKTYDSQRVKELAALLIQAVPVNEENMRNSIIHQFKDYWITDQQTVAKR